MRLELVPIEREEAAEFVRRYHRHAPARIGDRFRVAAAVDGRIVGVVQVGRPTSRVIQRDAWTAEVLRLCTDGTRNASSFLYAAAWRAARNLGYRRLVTYTLPSESGASLRAAGYELVVGRIRARKWHTPSRPRVEVEGQERLRWEIVA